MMHTDALINTATIQQFLMKDYCLRTLVRGGYWTVSHKLCCVIYQCKKMTFRVSTLVLQICSSTLSCNAFRHCVEASVLLLWGMPLSFPDRQYLPSWSNNFWFIGIFFFHILSLQQNYAVYFGINFWHVCRQSHHFLFLFQSKSRPCLLRLCSEVNSTS